ncbi:MAG: glycosyltransferase family 4 protein [Candidatus Eisenbacteria sp.]|nr:glycosyltransferase family 4 protein [Candidatus Eisenbacteria bacterium]
MAARDSQESVGRTTVVYYTDAPYYGGAEYYLRLLATGLEQERFDIHVILRPLDSLERLRRPLLDAGIRVFEAPEPALPDPRHWISVYRYLRRVGAEIFHVNLPGPYDAQRGSLPIVGKAAGARVVTTEHLPMFRGGWGRRLAKRASHPFVDLTITVSDTNVDCLRTIHGMKHSRIERVYNGVDLAEYSPASNAEELRRNLGLEEGEKAIGIIGRLDAQKRHDLFLEAAREVHARHGEARFLVVGDGALRASLEAMAGRLGIESVVRFLGYREDMPAVLGALDVVVFSSSHEGMPFAMLEAMAMGKPVVTSDVFGISEVIRDGHTGRLVAPGDSRAIAEALTDLLKSAERTRLLGARARETIAGGFTLEGMRRRTAELYESLIPARECP